MELRRYQDSLLKSIELVHMFAEGSTGCPFETIINHYNYVLERYNDWDYSKTAYDEIVRALLFCAIKEFSDKIIKPTGVLPKGYTVEPITGSIIKIKQVLKK